MSLRLALFLTVPAFLLLEAADLRAQAVGISSITTTLTTGSDTSQKLNGTSTDFDNDKLSVKQITDVNGGQYTVTGLATTAILRTDSTSTGEVNQTSAWYMGDAPCSSGSDPSTLYGSYNSGNPASLLLGNNLLEGSDNLFVNSSNALAEGNVERIDFLYNGTTGTVSNNNLAIGVFDRGTGDTFSVAIITGVDKNGNPTSYGGFITVTDTAFTGGDLLTTANAGTTVMNSDNNEPTDYLVRYDSSTSLATGNVTDDSESLNQNIQGVVFTLASLGIASGTKIYGYSLMGGDVTPGTNLNSLTNTTNTAVYHTDTSDQSGAFDGLDPVAVNGVMFSLKPVPEPSTYAEVFLVGALGLYGWRRRRAVRKSLTSGT